MSPTAQAILSSWSFDANIGFGIIASLVLYLRGWAVLHRTAPAQFPAWIRTIARNAVRQQL